MQRSEPGTLAVTVANRGTETHTFSVATTVDGATDMRQVRLPAHARRTLLIMVTPRGPVMNVCEIPAQPLEEIRFLERTWLKVRDHEAEHNYFYLDPCNLHPGQAEIVADRVAAELELARKSLRQGHETIAERRARSHRRLVSWPD